MKKFQKIARKVYRNLRVTYKNKLVATFMLLVGMTPVWFEGDGTVLLFNGIFAIPLFFYKENVIE